MEIPPNLPMPYLVIDEKHDFGEEHLNKTIDIPKDKYNVFHITQRYRYEFDWEQLINSQDNINYFVGLQGEYDEIIKNYNVKDKLILLSPKDMFDLAILIKHCDNLYCNPSVAHTIAVGMNKPYTFICNPEQVNVQTGLPIETLLCK